MCEVTWILCLKGKKSFGKLAKPYATSLVIREMEK